MQNRGVIPLFISASRLRPQPLLLLSQGFKANFHLLARPPFSIPAPELRIPPPRASVPVWADLHRATMHVARAVASQRWDRPAKKRSLLRQHMAIEECCRRGEGAAPAWRGSQASQMYRNMDTDFKPFTRMKKQSRRFKMGFWKRVELLTSPAVVLYLLHSTLHDNLIH